MGTIGVQELQKILLEVSINFSNLNFLTDNLFGVSCNGCKSVNDKKNLLKKTCGAIFEAITLLESLAETLLSSGCVENGSKIKLAEKTRELSYNIKLFLMTKAHVLKSSDVGHEINCECGNHNNIDRLIKIFVSVIDIK